MGYIVTINKDGKRFSYPAVGNRNELLDAAYDQYGVCGVTVMVCK